MNPILAAGPFDNPWVLAVIVIVGGLINWLSQRRQQKQESETVEEAEPSSSSEKTPAELRMEEVLRRLMGEETTPPPMPVPPPVPRVPGSEASPPPVWRQEPPISSTHETVSPARPPIVPGPRANVITSNAVSEYQKHAAQRLEQRQRHQPAPVAGGAQRARFSKRPGARWRDPRSARQAFVASVIFAPPKGLIPDET